MEGLYAPIYILSVLVVSVFGDQLCTPFTETCGPIAPSPPHQYVANVEVVDLLYNMTHYMNEYYDEARQMVAITERTINAETHSIFNYILNEAIIIETTMDDKGRPNTECYVTDISHDTPWMAGYSSNGSHAFIMSPSQALLFGDDYKYKFMSFFPERGIPCRRWDACINNIPAATFYTEYHWSNPGEISDIHGFPNERPVSMRLSGRIQPPYGEMDEIQVDNMYNFGFFDSKPEWKEYQWVFEIPSNVYCPGLASTKRPPSQLANAFSMRVEIVDQQADGTGEEYFSTVKQWYDFGRQLVRIDGIPDEAIKEAEIAGLNELAVIQDYTAGVEYIIDKALGNCTTIPIPDRSLGAKTGSKAKAKMKDPLTLFGMGKLKNLTYYGKKYARDLPCDVWIGHLDLELENETFTDALNYEIYLLESGWHEDGGPVSPFAEKTPEPILLKIQHDITENEFPSLEARTEIEQNIFKFQEEHPEMAVFDITPCFSGHQHVRRFQVAFPGKFREAYDNNPSKFIRQVHNSIAADLVIPPIRVQEVTIEFVNDFEGYLYAEFTLLDRPQVPGMDFPITVGPSLEETIKILEEITKSGHLRVFLFDPSYLTPAHTIIMDAYPNSLAEMFEDRSNSVPVSSFMGKEPVSPGQKHDPIPVSSFGHQESVPSGEIQQEQKLYMSAINKHRDIFNPLKDTMESFSVVGSHIPNGKGKTYSPGAMAGMGIGMFALGGLLGTVGMLVKFKKLPSPDGVELLPFKK